MDFKRILIHAGIILVLLIALFFGISKWLSSYTGHDEFVQVPDFINQKTDSLSVFIKGKDLSYKIIDSIYDPNQKHGIVIRQDPEANSKVKHNRTVYLYVTGMTAPQIAMPKLIDRSERQARLIIETYGLKVGRVTEIEADCNGCVISQFVKGKEIEPGKPVKKGSRVDLVIGMKEVFMKSKDSIPQVEEPNFENE